MAVKTAAAAFRYRGRIPGETTVRAEFDHIAAPAGRRSAARSARLILLVGFAALYPILHAAAQPVPASGPTAGTAQQLADELLDATRAGDYSGAVATLTEKLPANLASGGAASDAWTGQTLTRLVAAMLKLAEELRANGEQDAAAEVYHRAALLVRSSVDSEVAFPMPRQAAIWLAAARELTVAGRPDEALRWLREVSWAAEVGGEQTPEGPAEPMQRLPAESAEQIPDQLIKVAAGLLEQQSLTGAAEAYSLAESWGHTLAWEFRDPVPPALGTARLGRAWSLTMAGTDDEAALSAVDRFLKLHDGHPDAASAMLLRITCLSRLGRTKQREEARDALFARYPQSDAALQMAVVACETWTWSTTQGPGSPGRWADCVLQEADSVVRSTRVRSRERMLATGLLLSVAAGADHARHVYEEALWQGDLRPAAVGKVTTDLLQFLDQTGRGQAAERLAERWLTRLADTADETPGHPQSTGNGSMIAEAAGRWAGRTERWGLLAGVGRRQQANSFVARRVLRADGPDETNARAESDSAGLESSGGYDTHALHVARLFAESLLQIGQPDRSLRWWQAIVDQAGADDFPTLLRLAETSVGVEDVTSASTRLAKARAAADPTTQERVLVDLLAADVQVRQLQFDRGRSLLEGVVRSSTADAGLRGRAQWMIGETYFMQHRFAQAIDAYRLVEGISGDPHWTAASLVQAGKSFEQLGRTREAAVCYATLVQRFGDSQHAAGARDRLALLQPDASAPTGSIRR